MYQARFGPRITKTVKLLILINAAIFLLQAGGNFLIPNFNERFIISNFAVFPVNSPAFQFWQIFTYQFLHGGLFHIGINMFVLWMFGSDLENLFGEKEFLKYYLICGVGAGLIISVGNMFLLPEGFNIPTLGASGAIFGILLAYAVFWPDRYLLVMMVVPVKTKYYVIIIALISFFSMLDQGGSISHLGHLGGFIAGAIYLSAIKKINLIDRLFEKSVKEKFYKTVRKTKNIAAKPFYKPDLDDESTHKRVDELLDKISRQGIHSLTEEERQFLQAVSKKNRDQNADN